MASTDLVIVDEYLQEMKNYFKEKGELLDNMIVSYAALMSEVTVEAIVSGATKESLELFKSYADKLIDKIPDMVTEVTNGRIDNFVRSIDEKDQYLF